MAENKFIKHLKGEQAVGSLVEIKNQNTPASFGNMPQGTSDSNVKYSDVRGDVTIVANGTTAWKLNDSALTLAPIVNGDGTDYTGKYEVSGAGLWVNSTYTFPSTGDPNHPVAMIFNPNSKWVLKLCGDNLIVNNGSTLELNVVITIGSSNIISKQFTIREQANQFCKELVIDFDESNASMIKASGLATLQLQVLCGTADASARIYNGMTTLTVLQRKVDAAVVSGSFANVEEVMRDGLLPNDYFSNAAYIAQITDGDTAYAVFQRDGDDVALAGWAQPIPDQTNNAGKFLTTDGSLMSWAQLTISDVDGLSTELGDLQDQIDDLSGRGRFLALWNCATGLAESNPPESPYAYKAGDYFVVGTVSSADPAVNYKPDGSSYTTGVASTAVETNEVSVNDTYFYDGTVWKLQSNAQKEVSFSALAGSPYDNTNLSNALNAKQNTLTAGANISIENDIISSTAQESFFRGNFSTWENVPTNVNDYKENYKHEKTPTFGDFMVVADASDYVNPDFSDDPENVAFQRNPNAFTINIIVGNNTISVYYTEIQNNYKTIRELFTSKGYTGIGCEWLKLKYTPGSPGQWYITSTSNYYENNELVSANTDHLLMTTNEPVISMFYLSRNAGVAPIALFGSWRFSYYGVWGTDGKNGWKPEYQVEDVLPVATDNVAGIMKLYTGIGTHVDGTITQNGIKTQLDTKQDTLTAGTNIRIENNVISSTSTESFFRGPFANWASVPTTVNNYYPDIYGNKTPRNTDYIIIEDASQVPAGGDTISMTMRTDVYAAYPTQELTTVIGSESYTGTGTFGEGEIEVRIGVFAGYWSVFWKNLKNEVVFGGTTYPVGSDFNIVQILPPYSGTSTATLGISYPYSGTWRFGYRGQWNLEGRGGWKGEYAVEETLPIADDQTLGIAKLYTTTGNNTDGSMTQKSITDALNLKQDNISDLATIRSGAALGATAVQPGDLATIATTGDYDDLLNKPTLSAVATSGDYDDLSNKPTIPVVNNATLTIQKNGSNVATFTANSSTNTTANISVPTKTSDISNDSGFITNSVSDLANYTLSTLLSAVATSGNYSDLSGTPNLAAVATSGSYNDLNNKPTIPVVNNPTITITQGGVAKGSFTLNQATGDTIALDAGSGNVDIDNITITKNNNDELQAVATINANTATGATNPVYDWVGTLAEYTSQAVATNHPEWVCYITDDVEATAYQAYTQGQCNNLFVQKGHQVIEFQEPTAANNYTWYRKYADGWVEQGGIVSSTPANITFPVEMNSIYYYANACPMENGSSNYSSSVQSRTTTGAKIVFYNESRPASWEVKGMAA